MEYSQTSQLFSEQSTFLLDTVLQERSTVSGRKVNSGLSSNSQSGWMGVWVPQGSGSGGVSGGADGMWGCSPPL